ncbi:MAG: addiction module protein [Verrucomicrobiales bacterium]|nr:addiction module protein [Verrucomicrobiales bacterium]MDF1816587.1 addiction module protein [Verrucomicrobiales bacterium]
MIAEKFPELQKLDNQQKLILARELCDQAVSDTEDSLPDEVIGIIEERITHFMENPETGISWDDLKKKALEDA